MAKHCDPLEFQPCTDLTYPSRNANSPWKVLLENRFSTGVFSWGFPGSLAVAGRGHRGRVMRVATRPRAMSLHGRSGSFKGVPDFYFERIMVSFC